MTETPSYRPVPPQVDLPALEREVLEFWHANEIFEKSVARNEGAPESPGPWTFYEGPPTANGRPGTHHIESRTFKDVFPRFRTMQGYQVNRKGGWDCHGLPVELAVEKELGFSGKPDIEAFGIAEFNARCRESVQRYVDLWEQMTDRMGCWIDMRRPYRTMDPEYIESVWWALKQIHQRGLLVEDYRVAPYCPRCGTGLSDHELAQGYETVTDPSVYVRFPLTSGPYAGTVDSPGADLLVWTTTPWTLVSNALVAAHPEMTYVTATKDGETLVVAELLVEKALGEGWTVGDRFSGTEMVGWTYQRPFDLVEWPARTDGDTTLPDAHFVVTEDYVTAEDGTGLVHQSPAFGEDDFASCRRNGVAMVNPIDRQGHFDDALDLVGGQFFRHANTDLVADLSERGLLFRHVPYEHSYPHCWRCHTALLYYAQPSWYVRTTEVKSELLEQNEKTNWFPATIKHGRYGDWLENNIDWALSRSRYWGTPLPIWRCEQDHQTVVGSLQELSELTGTDQSGLDPHRPVRRRHRARLPDVRPPGPSGARGDRRLVRLRLDAVRTVGIPARRGLGGDAGAGLPRGLHLRGDRPDPWLVLHADGGRDAGLRGVVVPQRAVPRAHPGRGRPQDVQAPGQHPRADPADGRARRRRRALVHGRRRFAVGGPPGRAHHDPGDGAQGPADLLEHRRVPRPLRQPVLVESRRRECRLRAGAAGPAGAGPLGALRGTPAGGRRHRRDGVLRHPACRATCSRRTSTTCPTGTYADRAAASGTATPPPSRRCTSASRSSPS